MYVTPESSANTVTHKNMLSTKIKSVQICMKHKIYILIFCLYIATPHSINALNQVKGAFKVPICGNNATLRGKQKEI